MRPRLVLLPGSSQSSSLCVRERFTGLFLRHVCTYFFPLGPMGEAEGRFVGIFTSLVTTRPADSLSLPTAALGPGHRRGMPGHVAGNVSPPLLPLGWGHLLGALGLEQVSGGVIEFVSSLPQLQVLSLHSNTTTRKAAAHAQDYRCGGTHVKSQWHRRWRPCASRSV
jgi:hypothetical protein